jgi:ribosomal protein S18 acetylase RimI-like enzyme
LWIRPASREDLGAVRDLLVETWHDTYDRLLGAEKVTEVTNSWHSVEALGRQLDLPGVSFLVAEDSAGTVVGHILANAQRPPTLVISRLYVRPSAHAVELAGRLLADALARHPGSSELRLEVEAENAKGIGFYRRQGFEPVGERLEGGINHLQMRKVIAQAP